MDACSHGCCCCLHLIALRSLVLLSLLLPLPASTLDCLSQRCEQLPINSALHTACAASISILEEAIYCDKNIPYFNSSSGSYRVLSFDYSDRVLVLESSLPSPSNSNHSCYRGTLGYLVLINSSSPFNVSGSSSSSPSGLCTERIQVCASQTNGSECSGNSTCSADYHQCLGEIFGSARNVQFCRGLPNDGSPEEKYLTSCTVYRASWISQSSTQFNISWFLQSSAVAGTASSSNTPAAGSQGATVCGKKCKHKSISKVVVIGIAVGAATCATLSFMAVIWLCRQKMQFWKLLKTKNGSAKNVDLSQFFSDSKISSPGTMLFSYKELKLATASFAESRLLGDGGFSTVYEGRLTDGRVVAVKKLNKCDKQGVQQFYNEVTILSKVRHKNLVQLLGCCLEGTELMLVYEYVPNGTLADHIHGFKSKHLSWENRLMIATETAQALAYLHCFDSPPILHRDVKSSNILLDENFKVKVADFGLSRLMPADTNHISTAPQGTPGYLDPDYYESYELTDKSDVYSFGVVLMELISGKKAVDMSRGRKDINLASMAVSRIQCGALEDLVDAELEIESRPQVREEVSRVAELAFRCLASQKDDRPSMKEVAHELQSISSRENFKHSLVCDLSKTEEANIEKTCIDKHMDTGSNIHSETSNASSQNAETEIQ